MFAEFDSSGCLVFSSCLCWQKWPRAALHGRKGLVSFPLESMVPFTLSASTGKLVWSSLTLSMFFFHQGGAWWTHREAKGGTLSTYLTSTITTSFSLNFDYIRPTLLFKGDSHVSNKPWEKRGGSRLGKVIFSSNHREFWFRDRLTALGDLQSRILFWPQFCFLDFFRW